MKLLIGFFALLLAQSAHAATASTETNKFLIHQPFLSTRAMGMGNAFVAVADDYSAMFYNPAGLARIDKWQMNFEVQAMVDKDVMPFVKDVEAAGKTKSTADDLEVFNENLNKNFSSRVPTIGWYWVWPGWGIAVIPADLSLDVKVNQTIGPTMNISAIQDTTIAATYARNVSWYKKHKFSWGVTLKSVYRADYDRAVTVGDFGFDPKVVNLDQANEGITADADVGLLYSPDTAGGFWRFARYLRPTFGLAVRNAVDAGFFKDMNLYTDTEGGKPANLQRRVDFGTMLELPDWWVFKSRFSFDVRDMTHENWTVRKGLHAGVEFKWKLFGWWQGGWRAGLNQGYMTLGFTGKLGIFMLDIATYGEEVGSSETKQENRRYMAKASLDF